jgi:hypothetical protein
MSGPDRILSDEVRQLTGLPLRTVQALAERGKIPSAAKLCGRWTFNRIDVQRWIAEKEGEACQKTFIAVAGGASGGLAFKSGAPKYDAVYEQLLNQKRRSA